MLKCLLDLDGVLVDFCGPAHTYHNLPYSTGDDYPYPKGLWNIDTLMPITQEEFWKPLGREFWANLPWMPDGKRILSLLEWVFSRENICICSCPAKDPLTATGKLDWIKKNMPEYSRQYMLCPQKRFAASNNAILVDDRDKNIEEFEENGGHGVLVPRLWNKKWMHIDNGMWHILEDVRFKISLIRNLQKETAK